MTSDTVTPGAAPQSAPTAAASKKRGGARPARTWLAARAGTVRGWLGLSVLCGVGASALFAAQAALFAWVIAEVARGGTGLGEVAWAFAVLPVAFAIRAVCLWGYEASGIRAATRIQAEVRASLFRHIRRLGPARMGDLQSGAVASALVEHVNALEGYYARFLPQTVIAVLVPAGLLAAVFALDWISGLVLLFSIPLIPIFMVIVGMGAEQLSRQQMVAMSRLGAHFLDRLQGLQLLKLMGAAEREAETVRTVSEALRKRTMAVLRVAFLSSAVLEFFSAVAIAILAIYIGFALMGFITFGPAGDLTLFAGMVILFIAPEVFQPLRMLAQHYHDRAAGMGAAEELCAILDRPLPDDGTGELDSSEPVGASGGTSPPEVRFESVRVRYPDAGAPVLKDVSFTIHPGERVVLTGQSGSGKSTILNVLMGFLDIESGRVTLDGRDRASIGEADLRRMTGWLDQRCHIFHGTIAENIGLGQPDATRTAIETAAHEAGVTDFASAMPDGLDTLIGERGFGLSGGQAQRVALARLVLKGAPLILLDEPTARLDPDTSAQSLDALGRLSAGRTVLLVSHSADAARWADRVLRLADDGSVISEVRR